MTAPISNGPTTHGYTTMRDATQSEIHELLTNADIDDKTFRAWSYHYLDQSSAFMQRFFSR